jgi:hypothetical protein
VAKERKFFRIVVSEIEAKIIFVGHGLFLSEWLLINTQIAVRDTKKTQ